MFTRVGIIAKRGDMRVRETLVKLVDHLRRRGVDIGVDRYCAELLGSRAFERDEPAAEGDGRDLVIAIGGDGTMLRAAQSLVDYDVRLLGINLGRLGFLADLSPEAMTERLDPILDGAFVEEERLFLECEARRGDEVLRSAHALNDVVVEKWNTARLISVAMRIDGAFVNEQRCDGVIVATPTGSTAYALSGGGPILHPALDALVIVPICPHNLSNRPIVVGAGSEIEIEVHTPETGQAHLTCDGETQQALAPGDRVRVRRRDRRIRLIHPAGHDHYATLRSKLNWGTGPC